MRPLQSGLFVGLFLATMATYSVLGQNVADVVKQTSDAVVLIVISNSGGQETALGSGFLISADGRIVTNYHVIKDAHSAIVKLSNGAFFPANSVVAFDPEKDLAIIKVNGRNLPFLKIGNVQSLHVGDHVVAIGSPLGLEGTVSDGVVSAIRDLPKTKWIQTTAPVSHGNSGGPLLDMNNQVIGVITWGVNVQLGQNLNFAASADEIKALLSAPPSSKPAASLNDVNNIQRLGDIRKVAIESLGNTEGAGIVRERLINRLIESRNIVVVEDPSDADAVLNGTVAYEANDIYGAIRIATKDGRTLWGGDVEFFFRGPSSNLALADQLSDKLLTAIARDESATQQKR